MADLQSVLETLQARETEIRFKNKDWFLVRIVPYRTAEYSVEGVIVTFIDINNLKKSELYISRLNSRLEMAMNMGRLSWWELDLASNIMKTGASKSSMLGYSPEEIGPSFEDWTKLIHTDDLQRALIAMSNHIDGKASSYEAEYRILTKNGTYFWFKDRGGVTLRDKHGKALVVAGVVMDITHEKETSIALHDSEMKYSRLFHTMTQGVVYQNSEGFIVNANPAAEAILGLTLAQMQGRQSVDPDWKAVHADGSIFPGEEHPAMIALKTGKEIRDIIMGVYNPVRKAYSWININAIPLFRDNQVKPYMVYATFEDITSKIR